MPALWCFCLFVLADGSALRDGLGTDGPTTHIRVRKNGTPRIGAGLGPSDSEVGQTDQSPKNRGEDQPARRVARRSAVVAHARATRGLSAQLATVDEREEQPCVPA